MKSFENVNYFLNRILLPVILICQCIPAKCQTNDSIKSPEKVYAFVEQMPQFPGGQKAIKKYIKSEMHYPESAKKDCVDGDVVVKFIVYEDGSLHEVHIQLSAGPDLNKEAIRIIESMPPWYPGLSNGSPVKVYMYQYVTFKLRGCCKK